MRNVPQVRKLTESERGFILLSASMLMASTVEMGMALDSAFRLFDEVSKRADRWEQENWDKDLKAQQKYERGF